MGIKLNSTTRDMIESVKGRVSQTGHQFGSILNFWDAYGKKDSEMIEDLPLSAGVLFNIRVLTGNPVTEYEYSVFTGSNVLMVHSDYVYTCYAPTDASEIMANAAVIAVNAIRGVCNLQGLNDRVHLPSVIDIDYVESSLKVLSDHVGTDIDFNRNSVQPVLVARGSELPPLFAVLTWGEGDHCVVHNTDIYGDAGRYTCTIKDIMVAFNAVDFQNGINFKTKKESDSQNSGVVDLTKGLHLYATNGYKEVKPLLMYQSVMNRVERAGMCFGDVVRFNDGGVIKHGVVVDTNVRTQEKESNEEQGVECLIATHSKTEYVDFSHVTAVYEATPLSRYVAGLAYHKVPRSDWEYRYLDNTNPCFSAYFKGTDYSGFNLIPNTPVIFTRAGIPNMSYSQGLAVSIGEYKGLVVNGQVKEVAHGSDLSSSELVVKIRVKYAGLEYDLSLGNVRSILQNKKRGIPDQTGVKEEVDGLVDSTEPETGFGGVARNPVWDLSRFKKGQMIVYPAGYGITFGVVLRPAGVEDELEDDTLVRYKVLTMKGTDYVHQSDVLHVLPLNEMTMLLAMSEENMQPGNHLTTNMLDWDAIQGNDELSKITYQPKDVVLGVVEDTEGVHRVAFGVVLMQLEVEGRDDYILVATGHSMVKMLVGNIRAVWRLNKSHRESFINRFLQHAFK